MTRQTSIEAYNFLKDNNVLSLRRWEVYEALFEYGPCSASELSVKIYNSSKRIGEAKNVCARLNELSKMNVVRELGNKLCSITGMKVILWDVTDKLPVKFDKPVVHKCKACNGTGKIKEFQAMLL